MIFRAGFSLCKFLLVQILNNLKNLYCLFIQLFGLIHRQFTRIKCLIFRLKTIKKSSYLKGTQSKNLFIRNFILDRKEWLTVHHTFVMAIEQSQLFFNLSFQVKIYFLKLFNVLSEFFLEIALMMSDFFGQTLQTDWGAIFVLKMACACILLFSALVNVWLLALGRYADTFSPVLPQTASFKSQILHWR